MTENWFSQHDIGYRIKESPPPFKMMDHSRVGRTSGGRLQKVDAGEKVLGMDCGPWILLTCDLDYL